MTFNNDLLLAEYPWGESGFLSAHDCSNRSRSAASEVTTNGQQVAETS